MIDMSGERPEDRALIGDPATAPESESREPAYNRGVTDLVISLSARGRSIRLFTADGDGSRTYYPTRRLDIGLEEGDTDR